MGDYPPANYPLQSALLSSERDVGANPQLGLQAKLKAEGRPSLKFRDVTFKLGYC